MRKYCFADKDYKHTIDLKDYADVIVEAVHEICPDIEVIVESDGYILPKDVPHGIKVKIGMALAKTELAQYCLNRPVLFRGKTMNEQKNKRKQ